MNVVAVTQYVYCLRYENGSVRILNLDKNETIIITNWSSFCVTKISSDQIAYAKNKEILIVKVKNGDVISNIILDGEIKSFIALSKNELFISLLSKCVLYNIDTGETRELLISVTLNLETFDTLSLLHNKKVVLARFKLMHSNNTQLVLRIINVNKKTISTEYRYCFDETSNSKDKPTLAFINKKYLLLGLSAIKYEKNYQPLKISYIYLCNADIKQIKRKVIMPDLRKALTDEKVYCFISLDKFHFASGHCSVIKVWNIESLNNTKSFCLNSTPITCGIMLESNQLLHCSFGVSISDIISLK